MFKLVIFDRDGTLVAGVERDGRQLPPNDPSEVKLLPGAAAIIKQLQAAGVSVGMASNQAGMSLPNEVQAGDYFDESTASTWAKAPISPAQHNAIHTEFVRQLAAEGVATSAMLFLYCPHSMFGSCSCRKPELGKSGGTLLLELARTHFGLGAEDKVLVVGDGDADYQLSRNADVKFACVETGSGRHTAQKIGCRPAPLKALATAILEHGSNPSATSRPKTKQPRVERSDRYNELYLERLKSGIANYLGGLERLNEQIAATLEEGRELAQLVAILYQSGVSEGRCQGCGYEGIKYEFCLRFPNRTDLAALVVGSECIQKYVGAVLGESIHKDMELIKRTARGQAEGIEQREQHADIFAWLAEQKSPEGFLKEMCWKLRLKEKFTVGQIAALERIHKQHGVSHGRRAEQVER